jgi:hypothetical protein
MKVATVILSNVSLRSSPLVWTSLQVEEVVILTYIINVLVVESWMHVDSSCVESCSPHSLPHFAFNTIA